MTTGILLALFGATAAGAGDVFTRRALTRLPLSIVLLTIMGMILVGVTLVGLLTSGVDAYLGLSLPFFGGVAAMAVLGFGIGQTMHLLGLRKAGVTIVSPVLGTATLFAMLLGVTLGGERPNLPTAVGAFAIVIGVATVLSGRRETQV